jgi:hypothetical protein
VIYLLDRAAWDVDSIELQLKYMQLLKNGSARISKGTVRKIRSRFRKIESSIIAISRFWAREIAKQSRQEMQPSKSGSAILCPLCGHPHEVSGAEIDASRAQRKGRRTKLKREPRSRAAGRG